MNRDNLRIYMDIEIDDVYLISSFNNNSDTSFGIVTKNGNGWQLVLPSVDFEVKLNLEDLYKITSFVEHLNETPSAINEIQFPDWNEAPEWATYAAMDNDGDWYWYETRPCLNSILDEWDAPNQTRFHYMTTNSIIKCADSLVRKGNYVKTRS